MITNISIVIFLSSLNKNEINTFQHAAQLWEPMLKSLRLHYTQVFKTSTRWQVFSRLETIFLLNQCVADEWKKLFKIKNQIKILYLPDFLWVTLIKTFAFKRGTWNGRKLSKERETLLDGASKDESEKLSLLDW